jgi:hydroxymethylpyrimidine/phosphomethylpyrimidine kinase
MRVRASRSTSARAGSGATATSAATSRWPRGRRARSAAAVAKGYITAAEAAEVDTVLDRVRAMLYRLTR